MKSYRGRENKGCPILCLRDQHCHRESKHRVVAVRIDKGLSNLSIILCVLVLKSFKHIVVKHEEVFKINLYGNGGLSWSFAY